ncbi:MAG: hypothetical protein LBL87_08480 [Ruminococcus sp.]|jgi:hypothetical protein|nr:hypothetical protein [Ruminococcus sp.]
METIYQGKKVGAEYIVEDFVDRDYAENNGIRHFTAIIVPFITDGKDKSKWIVHDRTPKLWAKKKPVRYEKSYNLIGGHIKADDLSLKGKPMPYKTLLEGALAELSEELFQNDFAEPKAVDVEVWENGKNTGRVSQVGRYNHKELIPVGFTEYTAKNNVEYSCVFALPVPPEDYGNLVSADDYGKNLNVKLNLEKFSEEQLKDMYENDPSVEVCDAINRLWLPENAETLDKLRLIIG